MGYRQSCAALARAYAAYADAARPSQTGPMRMRVKSKVSNFGRLAGGVLANSRVGTSTDLDAVGEAAVSNAVKAIALANEFAKAESSPGLAFSPQMVTDEETGSKLMRLAVLRRSADAEAPPKDFSAGGIYVPVDSSTAGSRGASGAAEGISTPSGLSRAVLGEWMRFAAPELRLERRAAAAGVQLGDASSLPDARRQSSPFLLTVGPPALSRAVKALAFVCADVQKDHLLGCPPLCAVPCFWERSTPDRVTGIEKKTNAVVLWLTHASGEY